MALGTVLGAAIGGAVGSAALGFFNLRSTREEIRAQQQTARGEYYVEKKVEALIRAFSELKDARSIYKRRADEAGHSSEGISQQDYDECVRAMEEYKSAIDQVSIFLEEDDYEILLAVDMILRKTNAYLQRAVDYPQETSYDEFPLGDFNDKFDEAEKVLKEEVKGPIDRLDIEESKGSEDSLLGIE